MNSSMLDVKVDKADPTDLYEQVAGEIRRAIAEGEAKCGERLPPALAGSFEGEPRGRLPLLLRRDTELAPPS